MPSIMVRGRAAWIAALILGIALLIVGLIIKKVFLWAVGIGFAVFGLIFLILSIVTKGATD